MNPPVIVIIGGGPAGLFCALQAAGENRRVLVLEKKPSCGRKLLITGSGQCNLTHDGETAEFFAHYGDHSPFLRPALRGFTNRDLVAFFGERGLPVNVEAGGKIFPVTKRASDVLAILLSECARRGVEVFPGQAVRKVSRADGRFFMETGTESYRADAVVIATGGASYPATGSTGDGYRLARELGHTVTEIAPALTPVMVRDYPFPDLAGISFENLPISLVRTGKKVRQASGDVLFTHTGLSGPGILDLSRFILPGDVLKVSFLPGRDQEAARKQVTDALSASGPRQVKTVLAGLPLPERFVRRLLERSGIAPDLTCSHLPKRARQEIIAALTGYPFPVLRLGGFDEAMVTRGGVALHEIDPKTMESTIVPGLFCIGEVLDIDGDTGGYNLQAAFSTGMLAARGIAGRFPPRS
ncbi:MAG: NAD(P)/FAD-dependent oxidoreductase [Methanomicrobiales archaeon]|nr:NAD(P)/FAD-dependent oxidoreductase [Methanomicrobiales archaeon]NYT20436.1 NAD(P)/FAD-dependent oxidoreductase [Methanomicrobiales archaeon]